MKIGIDTRLWNQTGVGRYIRNLVVELAKIDKENEYVLFFRKEEFETIPLPGKNFQKRLADVAWHSLAEQTQFKKTLEKEKLDLVHFPYFSFPVGYKGKYVITIHDLIVNHFPTGKASTLFPLFYSLKHLAYQFVLSRGIKHAKKIISVSKATKQELIEHFPASEKKIVVTYEGIDVGVSKKTQEKIDVKKPYFFYVGNAYPHKNLERLVEGFRLFLEKTQQEVQLILVGREDYFYKRLEKFVESKKMDNKILFYKQVNDGQLAYLYHNSLAVVLPSLMEGFGLPAVEAMANDCLVVASEIPAFLEICGDVAEYFDPFNTESISKSLEKVYTKHITHIQDKKEMGEKRAKEFSWVKMAQETKEIYESSISV